MATDVSRPSRRALVLLIALALAASGLMVATIGAAPAQATIAQCTPPTNGFVSTGGPSNSHIVYYFTDPPTPPR